jgi:hypothetical protein
MVPAGLAGIGVNLKFEVNQKPRVEAPDESKNVHLPSLGNNGGKVQEGLATRGNSTYMDYYDEEVGMTSVESVVMDDAEEGKIWMITMASETNG